MAVKVMASYIDVSTLTRRKAVVPVRKQHAVGAWPLVGRREEESQAGSGGMRLIVPHKGTWKWSAQNGNVPVSRIPQRSSFSLLCIVRTLPDTSPLEVVEAAMQLSAAGDRGHLAWDLWQAEPLALRGPCRPR